MQKKVFIVKRNEARSGKLVTHLSPSHHPQLLQALGPLQSGR